VDDLAADHGENRTDLLQALIADGEGVPSAKLPNGHKIPNKASVINTESLFFNEIWKNWDNEGALRVFLSRYLVCIRYLTHYGAAKNTLWG